MKHYFSYYVDNLLNSQLQLDYESLLMISNGPFHRCIVDEQILQKLSFDWITFD